MDSLYQYYGVDWLLFVLVLIHMWLIAEQRKSAFVYAVLANICGFTFGLMTESAATLVMNVCFCVLNIRAYIHWHVKEVERGKEMDLRDMRSEH